MTAPRHVSLVLIKNFEIIVSTNEAGITNVQEVGSNVAGAIGLIDRMFGAFRVPYRSISASLTGLYTL